MSKLTKRLTALLLSGMLVIGSAHVGGFAAELGQTSEPAVEETAAEEAVATEEAVGDTAVPVGATEAPAEEAVEDQDAPGATDVPEEEIEQYYTVTLDANGGYFANEWDDAVSDYVERTEILNKVIPVGGMVTTFPVFTDPDGQTMLFAGWSLGPDGELVSQTEEEYIPVDNCVLYAVWKASDEGANVVDTEQEAAGSGDTGTAESAQESEDKEVSENTDTAQETAEDVHAVPETDTKQDTTPGQEVIYSDELNQEEEDLAEEKGKQAISDNLEDSVDTDIILDHSKKGVVSTNDLIKLSTPKNLMVSGTTLSWGPVENADYYYISIGVGKNGEYTSTSSSTREVSYDMQAEIRNLMSGAGYTDSSELTLYTEVSAETNNPDIYASSNHAKKSVPLSETGLNISISKLSTPKNLMVSGTTLSWSPVENADYYYISIGVGKNGEYTSTSSSTREVSYDMQAEIRNLMSGAGYTDSSELTLYTEVSAETNNPDIYASSNRAKKSVPLSETGLNITPIIFPRSIEEATITGITSKTYAGKAITQALVVKIGDTILEKDTDYTVAYSNNTNAGTATVTITGKGNYTGSKNVTFTIKKAAQSITASNLTLTFPKTGTISASGNKGKLTYKSDKTAIATVDSAGKVTAKGAGTAKITITAATTDNYNQATKMITVNVAKAAQSITAKAGASSVAVGKTTTVSITGNKGSKSFKSSDTSIATVTSAGKVTAKKVGTVKITATSAATANYKAASKTVTIKVVPAATASLTAANQATGIKLTWKKVTGANGYKVYRGSTLIKTITSGSAVTFADTKANTNGTKYTYKVVAKATTGDSTLSKSVTTYRMARPAISSVTNSAALKMTVKWGKNAKATGYQIQYSTSKTFATGNKTATITSASTVSKVIGSLTKNKTYYIRIRTYKTVGSTKYFSSWSPVKSVKISK